MVVVIVMVDVYPQSPSEELYGLRCSPPSRGPIPWPAGRPGPRPGVRQA